MVRDKVLAVVWLAANAAGAWSSRWIPVQGPDHGWALVVLVAITADPVMTRLVRGARRGLAPLWVAVGLSVPTRGPAGVRAQARVRRSGPHLDAAITSARSCSAPSASWPSTWL